MTFRAVTSRTICGAFSGAHAGRLQRAPDGAHGQVGARGQVLELAQLAPDLGIGRAV